MASPGGEPRTPGGLVPPPRQGQRVRGCSERWARGARQRGAALTASCVVKIGWLGLNASFFLMKKTTVLFPMIFQRTKVELVLAYIPPLSPSESISV